MKAVPMILYQLKKHFRQLTAMQKRSNMTMLLYQYIFGTTESLYGRELRRR